MSKKVEVTHSRCPKSHTSPSTQVDVSGSTPKKRGTRAVPTETVSPTPRSFPASTGAAAPSSCLPPAR